MQGVAADVYCELYLTVLTVLLISAERPTRHG